MGWLHGFTTIVLSCRLVFACAAVQSALQSGKAKGKHGNPCICWCLEVDADFAIAAIDTISENKHVVNFCVNRTNKKAAAV